MLTIAVVGTGLIGGSIGLAARSAGIAVTGFDPDPSAAVTALERGAVGAIAGTPEEAVASAEMVVLAPPVDRIPELCHRLSGHVSEQAVVTDVGSAKEEVVRHGVESFGPRFVGGHPMAGSERHGVGAADASLFHDAWWILTPTEATSSRAYSAVTDLVTTMGAKPVALEPSVHDALVARLSHVPQLTASALVDVVAGSGDRDALLGLAGAGFRDVTRIAASNPDMWVAIMRSNTQSVLEGLEQLGSRLDDVARMVSEGRWDDLHRFLSAAREARLELFAKRVYTGEPVALSMMIPDRPGVLAEVTTEAGNLGANIEDLRIIHSTEGGQGRLELVVAGTKPADLLEERLNELGYRVDRGVVD